MDNRQALVANTNINLHGLRESLSVTILEEIGRGASCIVYLGTYETNDGGQRKVRIKECYPFDLPIERLADGSLKVAEKEQFAAERQEFVAGFRSNSLLFDVSGLTNSIVNNANIYEGNGTVYIMMTFMEGETIDRTSFHSLKDILQVTKSVAETLQKIHDSGYLYLDMKPENVFLIRGTHELVQLFDFDSLLYIQKELALGNADFPKISYTSGFAATELQLGQVKRISVATDCYGVGALLFYMLFDRVPGALDCEGSAAYDYSRMQFGNEAYQDRLYQGLTEFFHKVLASYYLDRYQNDEALVQKLTDLVCYADVEKAYILSTTVQAPAFFIGRRTEMEHLHNLLTAGTGRTINLCGIGGIGKSSLVQNFMAAYGGDYDSVVLLYYRGSIKQMIASDRSLMIHTLSRGSEESRDDYYERKLLKLKDLSGQSKILLVVENFDNPYDEHLSDLTGLDCDEILISREPMDDSYYPSMRLDAVADSGFAVQMFERFCRRKLTERENVEVERIFQLISGHTLTLELLAKQVGRGVLTIGDAVCLIEETGVLQVSQAESDYTKDLNILHGRIGQVVERLFRLDGFSAEAFIFLKMLSLFDMPGIRTNVFRSLMQLEEDNLIESLSAYGWLQEGSKGIYLHALLQEVVAGMKVEAGVAVSLQTQLKLLTANLAGNLQTSFTASRSMEGPGYEKAAELLGYAGMLLQNHDRCIFETEVTIDRGQKDAFDTAERNELIYQVMQALPEDEDEAVIACARALLSGNAERNKQLEAHFAIATVLYDREQYREAYEEAKKCRKLIAFGASVYERAEYHYHLAMNLEGIGDPKSMQECFGHCDQAIHLLVKYSRTVDGQERTKALKTVANYMTRKAHYILQHGLDPEGQVTEDLLEEALKLTETYAADDIDNRFSCYANLALLQARNGQKLDLTLHYMNQATEIAKRMKDSDLYYINNISLFRYEIYYELGMKQAAIEELEAALQLCDRHPEEKMYQLARENLEAEMEWVLRNL